MYDDPFTEAERILTEWNMETAVNQILAASTIEELRVSALALTRIMMQVWRVLQDHRDRLHELDGRTAKNMQY
jgi:hypothetical protein